MEASTPRLRERRNPKVEPTMNPIQTLIIGAEDLASFEGPLAALVGFYRAFVPICVSSDSWVAVALEV